MVKKFYLKYLDIEYKWLDGTKTTVELIVEISGFGEFVLSYVHTDDDIETCKEKEDKYMEILLNVIKENCKDNDIVSRKGIY